MAGLGNGNSVRDELKDRFRNYLVDCVPGNSNVIEEAVCDLVDIAFEITELDSREQSMNFVE